METKYYHTRTFSESEATNFTSTHQGEAENGGLGQSSLHRRLNSLDLRDFDLLQKFYATRKYILKINNKFKELTKKRKITSGFKKRVKNVIKKCKNNRILEPSVRKNTIFDSFTPRSSLASKNNFNFFGKSEAKIEAFKRELQRIESSKADLQCLYKEIYSQFKIIQKNLVVYQKKIRKVYESKYLLSIKFSENDEKKKKIEELRKSLGITKKCNEILRKDYLNLLTTLKNISGKSEEKVVRRQSFDEVREKLSIINSMIKTNKIKQDMKKNIIKSYKTAIDDLQEKNNHA